MKWALSLHVWNITAPEYSWLRLLLLPCDSPISCVMEEERTCPCQALLEVASTRLMRCLRHAQTRIFRIYLILLFFTSFYPSWSLSKIWLFSFTLVLETSINLCTDIFKNNSAFSFSFHFFIQIILTKSKAFCSSMGIEIFFPSRLVELYLVKCIKGSELIWKIPNG